MTMIALQDAPGGAELIATLAKALCDLSLLFAGSPPDRALAALTAFCASVMPALVEAIGAKGASK
jgi:hypothetical protein